jgi:hypothetical protein
MADGVRSRCIAGPVASLTARDESLDVARLTSRGSSEPILLRLGRGHARQLSRTRSIRHSSMSGRRQHMWKRHYHERAPWHFEGALVGSVSGLPGACALDGCAAPSSTGRDEGDGSKPPRGSSRFRATTLVFLVQPTQRVQPARTPRVHPARRASSTNTREHTGHPLRRCTLSEPRNGAE